MKKYFLLVFLSWNFLVYSQSDRDFETDSVILNRIDEWQDLKFGFMMHWGIYSQWGIVESWSICNEPWITRNGEPYNDYVSRYRALNTTFNPLAFNPMSWADAASKAGMKYFVFTTKHHDGFCMFETDETNYSVTDSSCPFYSNSKANITGEIVKAFRDNNFWVGLYFSKPDWHCPDYWAPEWATPDRNVNYNPSDYPQRFQKYCDFTYNQIKELTHNYGDIDILWLDGGWVRPAWSVDEETRPWLGCQGWIQDVNIPKIAAMARSHNPDLLIVDRSVHGKYENYRTPEQQVPDTVLPYPWETCMSMGDSWSYVPNDRYKSTNLLIHLLVDIVSKGGNFLLNVGPAPDGTLPDTALLRMREIGAWMKVNGDAIYETRPIYPYNFGKVRFTQKKDKTIYAIYLCDEAEKMLPNEIYFEGLKDFKSGKIAILGTTLKATLKRDHNGYTIVLPEAIRTPLPSNHAVVFKLN